MSLKVRPFRKGGWEVDILLRLPDGRKIRERKKFPGTAKSAAQRWGEDRISVLLRQPTPERKEAEQKEIPTLEEFAPRWIQGYAKANRQKHASIVGKESV